MGYATASLECVSANRMSVIPKSAPGNSPVSGVFLNNNIKNPLF